GFPVSERLDAEPRFWSVAEMIKETTGLDLVDGDEELGAKAASLGIPSLDKSDDFETAFFKLLLLKVEPYLKQFPIAVLQDYPPSQAALARVEGGVAKRFEVYIHGVELSNGSYELQSPEKNR